VEYINSLEVILALDPDMIVPSHRDPVTDKSQILDGLVKMRDATQYVHDATIAGMNAGKTLEQLMVEIQLPPELALTQKHGKVSWAVKSIWEYYATWFHFDKTTELYPVRASEVSNDIVNLAGVEALIAKSQEHVSNAKPLHALHLIGIVLDEDENNKDALHVRKDSLEILLEEAETTYQNSYEIDWLKYRLRDTNARLSAAPE